MPTRQAHECSNDTKVDWHSNFQELQQKFLATGGKTAMRLKQEMARRRESSEPEPAEPEPIAKRTRSQSPKTRGSEPEGVKKTIKKSNKKKKKKKRTVQ